MLWAPGADVVQETGAAPPPTFEVHDHGGRALGGGRVNRGDDAGVRVFGSHAEYEREAGEVGGDRDAPCHLSFPHRATVPSRGHHWCQPWREPELRHPDNTDYPPTLTTMRNSREVVE